MAFWNRQIKSAPAPKKVPEPQDEPAAKSAAKPVAKPKGWVRWSGLGFVLGGVGLFFLIGYLGITLGLKSQLEKGLSAAWGAKVEIGAIDLRLFPLIIGLEDLAITDTSKPMENLIQIDRISASLNLYHWVIGRTVIEQLQFMDLVLHQPRQTSGALPKKPKPEVSKTKDASADAPSPLESLAVPLPEMALPSPETLLDRQSLQTVTVAKDIEKKLAEINQAWSNLETQIPSQQQLNDYQARFKTLTQGKIDSVQAFETKKAEFEALKQDLQTQQQALNKAQKTLTNQLPELQQQLKTLKQSPEQDYQRLLSTYSLDASGLSNFSYLVFGPQVQTWMNEGIKWFRKAEPVVAKLKAWMAEKAQQDALAAAAAPKRMVGQDIHFKEYDPQPDLIIKQIELGGNLDWGRLTAEASQVTFDHPKTRLPILFEVFAKPIQSEQPLSIIGESNFINPEQPVTKADVNWPQRQVNDWKIVKDKTLPLTLNRAVADVTGQIVLKANHQIDAWLNLDYQQVDMQIIDSPSKDVKRYVAPLFKDIRAFSVQSQVTGDWYAPKIGANSDLDKILSGAFNKLLKQELAKLKADLKAQLDAELAKQLAPIQKQLDKWLDKESQLALQQKGIGQILDSNWQANAKQALQQRLDAEVNKAKQQAQAKIDAEKAKLEAELAAKKQAAEQKAKQQAEQAAKDKLKNMFKF